MRYSHTYGVVIPSCGRPEFLEQALESVFAQTVQPVGCVVVMDADQGLFERAARKFGDRVRFLPSAARNANSARKQGARALIDSNRVDTIAFLDDDDIWLPSKMEKQLKLVSDEGLKSFVVGTRWASLKEDRVEPTYLPALRDSRREAEVYQILGSFSTMLVSSDLAQEIEDGVVAAQDWHYLLKLVQKGVPAIRVEDQLVLYRFHGSGSMTDDLAKRLIALRAIEVRFSPDMHYAARLWLKAQVRALEIAEKPTFLKKFLVWPMMAVAAIAGGPLRVHKFRLAAVLAIENVFGRAAVEIYRTTLKSAIKCKGQK